MTKSPENQKKSHGVILGKQDELKRRKHNLFIPQTKIKEIDQRLNKPFVKLFQSDLQLFTSRQSFNIESFRSVVELTASVNRSFDVSRTRLFFDISAIADLQSSISKQSLSILNATENLFIKLSQPVISSSLLAQSLNKPLFISSLTTSISNLEASRIAESQQLAFKSCMPVFDIDNSLKNSLLSITQRQKAQSEAFYKALINNIDLGIGSTSLKLKEMLENSPALSLDPLKRLAVTGEPELYGNVGKPHLAHPELLKSLGTTGGQEYSGVPIRGFPAFPYENRKNLFTPESPSRQPQLLVPQAIESSDPDAYFDPVSWDILTQVEQYLRSTIEKCLTKLSGSSWIKQRVSHGISKRWKQRQEEARSASRPVYDLIQYADFMDLCDIIVRSDNWRDAFESIFKNKNEIQISLQRLHPIRKSIAHSRPLSKSDALTLASEANQIFTYLGLECSLKLEQICFRMY